MGKFVEIIAPEGVIDWILKYIGFAVAIVAVNTAALVVLADRPVVILEDVVMPLVVGTPFIFVFLCSVSHMAKLQMALRRQAVTDPLTGLPNRRVFMGENGSSASDVVLAVDIDWFKSINDRFGHSGGDRCLVLFAAHLRQAVREDDLVARMGGEEFAILLRGADPDTGRRVGERISRGTLIELGDTGQPIRVSASVGMAVIREGTAIEEAFTLADEALYRAKRSGRARMIEAA